MHAAPRERREEIADHEQPPHYAPPASARNSDSIRAMLRERSARISATRRLRARARAPPSGSARARSSAAAAPALSPTGKNHAPFPSATHSWFASRSLTTGSAPAAMASSSESEVESERAADI